MLTARIGVGVSVVKRLLYAIGGYDGNSRLNTVECYHPEKDSWTEVASMNTNRSGAGELNFGDLEIKIGIVLLKSMVHELCKQ